MRVRAIVGACAALVWGCGVDAGSDNGAASGTGLALENTTATLAGLILMTAAVLGTGARTPTAARVLGWVLGSVTVAWHVVERGWATGGFRALWLLCLGGMVAVALRQASPRSETFTARLALAGLGAVLAWKGGT